MAEICPCICNSHILYKEPWSHKKLLAIYWPQHSHQVATRRSHSQLFQHGTSTHSNCTPVTRPHFPPPHPFHHRGLEIYFLSPALLCASVMGQWGCQSTRVLCRLLFFPHFFPRLHWFCLFLIVIIIIIIVFYYFNLFCHVAGCGRIG